MAWSRSHGTDRHLRPYGRHDPVGEPTLIMAVDTDDELVHAKCWKRKSWEIRGETNMLIVADGDARWPAYVERQPCLKGLHQVRTHWHLNGLPVLANKFDFDLMLLVCLAPGHGDHDPDTQIDSVGRVGSRWHEADVDSTSCDVEEVVHSLCVVAQDCIDLHGGLHGMTLEVQDGMTVSLGVDDRQGGGLHPRDAEDLEFDEINEAHLARRGIIATEVTQVWLNQPVYVPNKRGLTATWLMLGDTAGGRSLTVAVLTLEAVLRLRPITGWNSTAGELTRWRRRRL